MKNFTTPLKWGFLTTAIFSQLSYAGGAGRGQLDDDPYEKYFNIGRSVDASRSDNELTLSRAPASHKVDSCVLDRKHDTFAEAIGWGVEEAFKSSNQHLNVVSYSNWDPFNMYRDGSFSEVTLMSHPICETSKTTLRRTLSSKTIAAKMPDDQTIRHIQTFTERHNSLRKRAIRGNEEAKTDLKKLWGTLMTCLSYIESLGDPDTQASKNIARRIGPDDYSKPQGVKFYFDPNQPPVSAFNIGLYQFSRSSKGNVQGCIRKWNDRNPNCQLPRKASDDEMTRILGSSRQSFNAFCGANQVLNTFGTQVNTWDTHYTSRQNVGANGKLKPAAERCVSPHFRTRRAYNHFSPLHNGTGSNLNWLMSCTMQNL